MESVRPLEVVRNSRSRAVPERATLATLVNHIMDPTPTYFDPLIHTHIEADIELGLERLYSLESMGIHGAELGTLDEQKLTSFRDSIEFRDGHYYVSLPWHEDLLEQVPNNAHVALATLNRVYERLRAQDLLNSYGKVFHQQLADGIIEKMEIRPQDYHKYIFIPHRAVLKQEAQVTTKLRVVFNCSLKVGGAPSLNQASYGGIDLLSSLFGLLLGFRTNKYVIIGDIKAAFLQIKLKDEADRNRFCFFWKESGSLQIFRYSSLVFGLSASPFALNYVIKYHASQYEDDLVTRLLNSNFYCDNFLYTSSKDSELQEVYKTSVSRMAEGGFRLQSWNTNLEKLKDAMKQAGNASSHDCPDERVLGYLYDFSLDTMRLADFSLSEAVSTKRQLLSEISKIFDPLGLFVPVCIRGRLLMRHTWAREISWDEDLGEDIPAAWIKLRKDLEKLKELSFPRAAFETCADDLSINIYCDASIEAFGFVVYVVQQGQSSILMAKAKVSPVKGRTLPSLELLSIFLALKCLPQVLSSFPDATFRNINLFSDSQISLTWVLSQRPQNKQIFIRNRVNDIHTMVKDLRSPQRDLAFWYVRTDQNPADLLTRGISFREFSRKLDLWKHGPSWSALSRVYWPMDHEFGKTTAVQMNMAITEMEREPPVVKFSDFDSVAHLFRVCALLYRFGDNTRGLSSDCYARAQLYCLKVMQFEGFSVELEFLKKARLDPTLRDPIPDLVNRLDLFLDDQGLIRSRGRMSRSNYYQWHVINPILLHKRHHVTHLIIKESHCSCLHLGLQSTLTHLRMRGYWVTSARITIKKVLAGCVVCNKYNNLCFKSPKFTNMTKAQVELFRPFANVGVDFTFHFMVKSTNGSTSKVYILIYTCLNIRAIHLDLLNDMSTKSFIQSFKRFTNRFGVCDFVYSDNARSFVQGGDLLEHSLVSEEFQQFMTESRIKHRRIPLYSPWMGAQWERLIRVVKSCLYKAMGRSVPEYFEFTTLLSDIENVVNNRPLTYVASNEGDLPLTPNSFLKPHAKTSLVISPNDDPDDPGWEVSEQSTRDRLISCFEGLGKRLEDFRARWYREYLLGLREFSQNLYQSHWEDRIQVGDVVIIESPIKPRPFWQLGRVLQLVHGGDGRVRTVLLKTPAGQNYYPIKVLHPLELSVTHRGDRPERPTPCPSRVTPSMGTTGMGATASGIPSPATGNGLPPRPVRRAAVVARQRCKKWTQDYVDSDSD